MALEINAQFNQFVQFAGIAPCELLRQRANGLNA